jgi:RNA polymerase sigma-70 factor (ECF subfamily)
LDDIDFIKRLKDGDESAYYRLIEKHKNMVMSVGFKILKDRGLAEDTAQETFITVFNKIHTFRGKSKLSTWIYRIAYNKALEVLRKERKGDVSYEDVDFLYEVADTSKDPEDLALSESFSREVRDKLSQLPDKYRIPLSLYYLSDKSYKDVAEIMDIPIGSVKTYLYRGKKELLKLIKKEEVII